MINDAEAQVMSGLFNSIEEEIMRIYTEAGEERALLAIRPFFPQRLTHRFNRSKRFLFEQ